MCIIDNLELLRTSVAARDAVETFRDPLFSLPGIRWVMCGARGIVHGVASSPRLNGYLHRPVEISEFRDTHIKLVFTRRTEVFAKMDSASLPISADEFDHLFHIFKGNLRDVFSACDDFCVHIADEYGSDISEIESLDFDDWLDDEIQSVYKSTSDEISGMAISLFISACRLKSFLVNQIHSHTHLGKPETRNCLRELEDSGLLISEVHVKDRRRKIFTVTPKGWLAFQFIHRQYSLRGSNIADSGIPDDALWNLDSQWSGDTDA